MKGLNDLGKCLRKVGGGKKSTKLQICYLSYTNMPSDNSN